MNKNKLGNFSFLALFAGVSLLLFFVFAPFIQILALAAVFAAIFHGFYEDLAKGLHGWKSIAALIVVAVVLIFCIVPLFFLGSQIFHEAQSLYSGAQGNGTQYIQTVQTAIENPIRRIFPDFSFDIGSTVENLLSFISGNLGSIVSQTFFITLETFLMLLTFFFFLRDGKGLLTMIASASPLGKEKTHEILHDMYQTVHSVVVGTLIVAIVRWVFIGIGFFLFHIPNAVLWSSVGGFVGAIPGVGPPLVFIPAIIFLYLEGHTLAALGLAIYGIVVVTLIDNILTPYLFSKGLPVPSIFILFAILGGIIFFGPLGFIFGPLVLTVFLSVFKMLSAMTNEA